VNQTLQLFRSGGLSDSTRYTLSIYLFENGRICDAVERAIAVILSAINEGTARGDERFCLVLWAAPTRHIGIAVEPG